MDLAPLTPGVVDALSRTSNSSSVTDNFVLQILSVRAMAHVHPIPMVANPTHYLAIFSDGTDFFKASLSQNVVQQYGVGFFKNSVVGVDRFTWIQIPPRGTWLPEIAEMHIIEQRDRRIGAPDVKFPFPDGGSESRDHVGTFLV
ncbi:hypothetical protein DFH06DRAFT_1142448 [Mycena polygramma]|nr:hypothetical protein DFH06DRAFT_1142448 [Mycena polygramma]